MSSFGNNHNNTHHKTTRDIQSLLESRLKPVSEKSTSESNKIMIFLPRVNKFSHKIYTITKTFNILFNSFFLVG